MECPPTSRGILTFAFGKRHYLEMARSLARSLILNAPSERRALVTDSADPHLRALFHDIIPYRPEYGANVRQKIFLDRYTPYDRTLFIDSDSLVLRDLSPFWQALAEKPFGVPGHTRLHPGDTDEYMNVDFILNHFHLDSLPKFNGGVYYFDRSSASAALFSTARELLSQSRHLTFVDFRNDGPNDESIYSVAMAIHGLSVTDMGPGGMWTPIAATSPITIDVARGICSFAKRGRPVLPEILHFATFTESYLYLRECHRLERLHAAADSLSPAASLTTLALVKLRAHVTLLRLRKFWRGSIRRLRHPILPASLAHPRPESSSAQYTSR